MQNSQISSRRSLPFARDLTAAVFLADVDAVPSRERDQVSVLKRFGVEIGLTRAGKPHAMSFQRCLLDSAWNNSAWAADAGNDGIPAGKWASKLGLRGMVLTRV